MAPSQDPSTIQSPLDGSPPHELRSQGGASGQFSLRNSSAKSRSHGAFAAASKARRKAAVIPAWPEVMSNRISRRSILFISDAVTSSRSGFIAIANEQQGWEVSSPWRESRRYPPKSR